MHIGDAQVGIVFAIQLFDELFKSFYRKGLFPRRNDTTVDTPLGQLLAAVFLSEPAFEMVDNDDETYTRLRLTGHVELRPANDPDGDPINDLPLDTSVRLSLTLFEVENDAPVLGLTYDGVDEPPALPLTAAMVDQMFTTDPIASLLADVELDVVGPVITALSDLSFPDGDAPAADEWDTDIALLTESTERWASVCIYVAQPDTLNELGDEKSFMPWLTEFGLVFGRDFMDDMFASTADDRVGTDIEGATITYLSLTMEDDCIRLVGGAERDGGTVAFGGPIDLALVRGTDVFTADTSKVEVDTDLPWCVDLLLFFTLDAGVLLSFGLGPLIGDAILASSGTHASEIHAQLVLTPNLVRGGISEAISSALDALSSGLRVPGDVSGVRALSTTDRSVIEDGHLLVLTQVFVNPLTSDVTGATYSKPLRRFVEYELDSSRLFAAGELVRLMDAEMIFTRGHHAVHHSTSPHLRANPDEALDNNLGESFGTESDNAVEGVVNLGLN